MGLCVIAAQITRCLNALVALVFRLVLADTICVFVTEWIVYLVVRKQISKPGSGEGGLKVIICGFPRSGSKTLQEAMGILGFPCFHGRNLLKPSQCRLFMKARKSGKQEEWDRLLKGYTSISDFTATSCYKDLMEIYPNSKVILNIRDASKWYKSFSDTILKIKIGLDGGTMFNCVDEVLFKDILKGKEKDEAFATHMYNLHTREVKAHVQPHSRLLVYEFGENTKGWAPLCEFLGVEVPLVPFPHANDSEAFKSRISFLQTIHTIVVASYFTLLSCIAFFILMLLSS